MLPPAAASSGLGEDEGFSQPVGLCLATAPPCLSLGPATWQHYGSSLVAMAPHPIDPLRALHTAQVSCCLLSPQPLLEQVEHTLTPSEEQCIIDGRGLLTLSQCGSHSVLLVKVGGMVV